jgi:hypothetical protein
MPSYSSGKGRTSAIFYRRGVPNSFGSFGVLTQANYPIVQPQRIVFYDFLRNINRSYYKK